MIRRSPFPYTHRLFLLLNKAYPIAKPANPKAKPRSAENKISAMSVPFLVVRASPYTPWRTVMSTLTSVSRSGTVHGGGNTPPGRSTHNESRIPR